jgi:hypothetical protein
MHVNDDGHHKEAVLCLADRDYASAGDSYARAGWSILSEPRSGRSPFDEDDHGYVGRSLQEMFMSAVCYRIAGQNRRARSRSECGVAVSEDLAESFASPVQRACLKEFVADFRVVSPDGERYRDAYEEAAESYRSAVDEATEVQTVSTTALFRAASEGMKQMGRTLENGEIAVEWQDLHGPDPSDAGDFLAHRARYKLQRLPSLVDGVIEEGFLAAPRGSTEYNTDHHRCPECGSEDVNWVADTVLCLRCSGRTEPQ